MPKEVFLVEIWRRYAENAEEIRVKRMPEEGVVKLKARLSGYLYTIKLPVERADAILGELKEKGKKIVEY
ncbi:MAG: 50S ribosomal protein L38e [Thermoproteus sp.]|jgi:large subunit ribosomal protein L38e|uniref:50S ribosomal protein L38e n=1 Tax=Thermoproteus sp. CP80 TaxID=1650659 RepID=UPI0009BEBE8C|nr:50S ribosomal protein L38e [Thermoproteus sp. CP80]MDT7870428.1 50S ribosomal protein L38e [Thermoproteus sp.]MDT7882738.1 50S ribosomal protein L38e [Thermoproteus sp.]PLC62254.1 50S ribosomal protein L38e [Thermoproteus sp. CP80]